jgi:single-strand DNA-binding protein
MTNKTYINAVEIQGFVGAEAAPSNLQGGKTVLNFTVATNRFRGEGEAREQFTEWHKVTAWETVATSTGTIAKGALVNVKGELRSREYTNGEGTKVQTYEIVARKITRVENKAAEAAA